jgi:hypothetical protein
VAFGRVGSGSAGWAGSEDDLDGMSSSSRLLLNFCDDLRGGGLGGSGDSLFFFFFLSLSFLSPSRTVELDDEDVRDSLTAAKPWRSALIDGPSFGILPALLRVTGGLVWADSACLTLAAGAGIRIGATRPGDCDDMDVGVVSRL